MLEICGIVYMFVDGIVRLFCFRGYNVVVLEVKIGNVFLRILYLGNL